MATVRSAIVDRISSLCASVPFSLSAAPSPFDFDTMPSQAVDGAFRVEADTARVIGGFGFTGEQTDQVTIWVARKMAAGPVQACRLLMNDMSSLTAAVIRDGAQGGGDYAVEDDGIESACEHDDGREFAVGRLTLPINYEVQY